MTRLSKMFVLIATLASIAVTPSLADRKPTLEERSRIETKLRELGYTSWDEIEFDESATPGKSTTHAWPTAGTTT